MGAIKDGIGSLSYGLWIVAAFEALTVFLILYFIPKAAGATKPTAAQERVFGEVPATATKI